MVMKSSGSRLSIDEIKDSLVCGLDLRDGNCLIVLIDDIVTSGNTLNACRKLLIEHGAKPGRIVRMAIARTVWR